MKTAWIIAKKELGTYFKSPIAYIILTITVSVFNIFFFILLEQNREASLRDMFQLMEFMFVFIVPLLTMRLFCEEKRLGTIEFLMTNPISNESIVLGKYFGSLLFFASLIALTGAYYFILEYFAKMDGWAAFAGYLGIGLEGALFIAIGLLMSSLTKNQIIAGLSSYAVIFMLYFSISFIKYFDKKTKEIIKHASVWSHTGNFFAGLITGADCIYFLSGILFCLILTRLTTDNHIWK